MYCRLGEKNPINSNLGWHSREGSPCSSVYLISMFWFTNCEKLQKLITVSTPEQGRAQQTVEDSSTRCRCENVIGMCYSPVRGRNDVLKLISETVYTFVLKSEGNKARGTAADTSES